MRLSKRPSWLADLPPSRAVDLAGDELSTDGRLIRLFRDSYAASQGRQWMQPHIVWWLLKFLRHNGVAVDWDVVTSPALATTVSTMRLPAGHAVVDPAGQASMNFGLWWSIVGELAELTFRPWAVRLRPGRALPGIADIRERAFALGLRPWMSSATVEEVAAIDWGLRRIEATDRWGLLGADEFMVRVLLPELLLTELHWLHARQGRPSHVADRSHDVVLTRRHQRAYQMFGVARYLTPLDHLYLRAGDIATHLSAQRLSDVHPRLRPIVDLHHELSTFDNGEGTNVTTRAPCRGHEASR